jgi:hypothetical protein
LKLSQGVDGGGKAGKSVGKVAMPALSGNNPDFFLNEKSLK